MEEKNIKLVARYIIIAFVLYLCYMVTSLEYILAIEESKSGVLQVTTGSIFAALTLILNYHFNTKVD